MLFLALNRHCTFSILRLNPQRSWEVFRSMPDLISLHLWHVFASMFLLLSCFLSHLVFLVSLCYNFPNQIWKENYYVFKIGFVTIYSLKHHSLSFHLGSCWFNIILALYLLQKSQAFFYWNNWYHPSSTGLLLYVRFSNHSELPLSINEIAVLHNNHEYISNKISVRVLEQIHKSGKQIISQHDSYSMQFPINLAPLCGDSGYLFFSAEKDDFPPLSKQATLIIRTNRGREVRKTLSLGNLLD